jgi:hypothetical protein
MKNQHAGPPLQQSCDSVQAGPGSESGANLNPLSRLLGSLEAKVDSMHEGLSQHAAEDIRTLATLRVELRTAIERMARELAERQATIHGQNVDAIRRLENKVDELAALPREVAAMREILHGDDGSPGLVEGLRNITAIIDGDRGRRAAFALVGALLVGLVGIGSGIANLWHLIFSPR